MKLIHYGSTRLDLNLIKPIKNYHLNKPIGGLWTCPTKSKWSWKDWCKGSGFSKGDFKKYFKLELKKTAKILVIDNFLDFKSIFEKFPYENPYSKCVEEIDFEKISKEYDAIWLTEKGERETHLSFPINLYTWDCESVLVLNKEMIKDEHKHN